MDIPVVALQTSSTIPGEPEESLKPEDRRTEQTLQKTHQAAACTVCASTTASFFNRASLLWLRQMKKRIPATEVKTHQDINKLMAADQFSDAMLNVARFASKAVASVLAHQLP